MLPVHAALGLRLLALSERLSPGRMWPSLSPDSAESEARAVDGELFDAARAEYAELGPQEAVEVLRAMLPAQWERAGSIEGAGAGAGS